MKSAFLTKIYIFWQQDKSLEFGKFFQCTKCTSCKLSGESAADQTVTRKRTPPLRMVHVLRYLFRDPALCAIFVPFLNISRLSPVDHVIHELPPLSKANSAAAARVIL